MLQANKESAFAPPVLTKAKDPPLDEANCPSKQKKLAKLAYRQNISITDPFEKVILKECKHLREPYLFPATSF